MKAARRLQPAVEPERADQRFDHVAEHIVALEGAVVERLLAEPHMRGEVRARGATSAQVVARDQHVQPARQLALGLVGEEGVEPVGDDQAEHPVAEEFEPLVIVLARGSNG